MSIVYVILLIASLLWVFYSWRKKSSMKVPIIVAATTLVLNIFPQMSYLLLVGALGWLGFSLYKKKAFKYPMVATAVALALVFMMPSGGGGGFVKIGSPTEAENYAIKHISKNITMAGEINKTQGYELFALGNIDKDQAILRGKSLEGETVEGFFLYFVENYNDYSVIVTYDGAIYLEDKNFTKSKTTARTAVYKKIYDAKKGWLL